ncbi:MAG: replication initiator protein A, partial [Caldilineaceae bacterium]|nr:replication initiator protein A [Caldilineaceae bacterium]
MTNDERRQGKDEMNLAVLPIARLGRNDRRTRIEYRGSFREPGRDQEEMVWIVEGAAGLPTEFAERVMVALLYIGAKENFTQRKMTFTVYGVLKVLGLAISNRNYRLVEKALKQLAGVLITSDKAWIERN